MYIITNNCSGNNNKVIIKTIICIYIYIYIHMCYNNNLVAVWNDIISYYIIVYHIILQSILKTTTTNTNNNNNNNNGMANFQT